VWDDRFCRFPEERSKMESKSRNIADDFIVKPAANAHTHEKRIPLFWSDLIM